MKVQRHTFCIIVLLIVTMVSSSNVESKVFTSNENYLYCRKIEPRLLEIIQEMEANRTVENVSVTIWLRENLTVMSMSMEDLKIYAASTFTSNFSANVFYVGKALSLIMAKVSANYVFNIASYEFVEYITNGNGWLYPALDVSKKVIRADNRQAASLNGYNGSGLNIAIIDSGINRFHLDLDDFDDNPNTNDPKVIQEISFVDWDDNGIPDVGPADNYGHGTLVAGIAAGTGEASGYQYVGVALGAWLWNYKVIHFHPILGWIAQPNDIEQAIDDAITAGAGIINLSIEGEIGGNGTSGVSRAADGAVARGVVVVAAAGNEGPNSQTITSPGDAFNVITVGTIDDHNTQSIRDDTVADFSSRGPTGDGRTKPDVMAPGVNIIAPIDQGSFLWQNFPAQRVGNFYFEDSGTSYAAPHVAGVAALLLQAHPNWTPNMIKEMVKYDIKSTANLNDILQPLTENDRGKGIVDASRAVSFRDTTIPVNQAQSKHEEGIGDYVAHAYLSGWYQISAGTQYVNLPENYAIATLKKTFTLNYNSANPQFFFVFHDKGFMDPIIGWAEFSAILGLYAPDGTLLFYFNPLIHSIDTGSPLYIDDNHEINYTYSGTLLAGQTYTIEYGFNAYAHYAYSDFASLDRKIEALLLITLDGTIRGPGNSGFEERAGSVSESWYWANNRAGWRELRGDCAPPGGDGQVFWQDLVLILTAFGSRPGDPNWNPDADLNGDNIINYLELQMVLIDYSKTANRKDGFYSWYTDRGGDYMLAQWLCDHDVNAMKGKQVNFTFWFLLLPDGLGNCSRAEIRYITSTGSDQTINGTWVYPTQITWYSASITTTLPFDTIAIQIIIHGQPNFKAWIDKTSITIT